MAKYGFDLWGDERRRVTLIEQCYDPITAEAPGPCRDDGSRDLLARLYKRHREHYIAIVLALLACIGAFVTAVGALTFALFAGRPALSTLEYIGVLEVLNVAGMGATYLVTRPIARPLLDWIGGAMSDPGRAWDNLAGIAPRMVSRGVAAYSLVFLIAIVPTHLMLKVPFSQTPFAIAGFELAIVFAAGLDALTWDWIMRPVLLEIDTALAASSAPRSRGIPLRTRVLSVPMVSTVTLPVVVVGIMTPIHASPAIRLGIAVLASLLLGVSLGLVATGLAARVVLEPVNALIGAVKRVAASDLTARVPVAGADELADLTLAFNQMVRGLAERQALQSALGAYVDPHIANRLVTEGVLLEGAEVEATLMMLDIRDFTTFAERRSPTQVVAQLNELWSVVIPIIRDHDGHVNKFVGDAILAVFGTPISTADHATAALGAACAIVDAVEREFQGRIRIGVGINTGAVLAGTLGGGGRFEFTVIGDAVNVAARVEQLTKETNDAILLTDSTFAALGQIRPELITRGAHALRGREGLVRLYAVGVPLSENTATI